MAKEQSILDLFPVEEPFVRAKHRGPPKDGADVTCHTCGLPSYRKKSKLGTKAKPKRLHPNSGLWFCSRKCQHAASVKVALTCPVCFVEFFRYPSQMDGRTPFCSPSCRNKSGLCKVGCVWPGCHETMDCRLYTKTDRNGKTHTVYKTSLTKTGSYSRSVLCEGHLRKLKSYLGENTRLLNGRLQIFYDPYYEYGHRASSSKMFRAIVFDRAEQRCQGCGVTQDFNAPPKTWEIDHIVPVFRGGSTSLMNSQILCKACHDIKSSPEKSEASLTRQGATRLGRWMTHREKDIVIASLREELAVLRGKPAIV